MRFATNLRKAWFQVHLWLGVALAVLVIPLGLTGSALVFSQELGRALSPQRYAVSGKPANLPASVYLAKAQAAMGDRAKAFEVRLPYKPSDPVTVTGKTGAPANPMGFPNRPPSSLTVWMEPSDARVLDVADPRGGTMSFIHRLHGSLAVTPAPGAGPGWGRLVVGWLGVALAISSVTGLWLWWPRGVFRWSRLGRAFAWKRSPSTLDNLHHMAGFWISLPLLFLSLTGIYIAFPAQSHALFGAPQPLQRPQMDMGQDAGGGHAPNPGRARGERHADAKTPSGPALGVDQAVSAALAARPGKALQVVTAPTRKSRAWTVEFSDDSPAVLVDATTGHVAPAPPERRRGDPISDWMRQSHEGEGYGPVWKWIAFVTGFAPTLLAITGILLWLGRRKGRRLVQAA